MKKPHILYTVVNGRWSTDIVKYAIGPKYEVQVFSGAFNCPGEASQEFKIAVEGEHEYLAEKAFERKVDALSTRYQQDLARLRTGTKD